MSLVWFINPRRACAARVTVVGFSVCLSVCLLSHISPMERLFVLKTLSRTQRATKVKKFVGFSLKPLHCTAMRTVGHFSMRISRVRACVFLDTRMIHRRGFSTLVLFIYICTCEIYKCIILYNVCVHCT